MLAWSTSATTERSTQVVDLNWEPACSSGPTRRCCCSCASSGCQMVSACRDTKASAGGQLWRQAVDARMRAGVGYSCGGLKQAHAVSFWACACVSGSGASRTAEASRAAVQTLCDRGRPENSGLCTASVWHHTPCVNRCRASAGTADGVAVPVGRAPPMIVRVCCL